MGLWLARIGGSPAVNRWHAEHPAALGIAAVALGLLGIFVGARSLAKGPRNRSDKLLVDNNRESLRDLWAVVLGVVFVVLGVARLIYALFVELLNKKTLAVRRPALYPTCA